MCDPRPTPYPVEEKPEYTLAKRMSEDLGLTITPVLLRLWIKCRWDELAKLAHKIHGDDK